MTAKERTEAIKAITEFLNSFGSTIPEEEYQKIVKKGIDLIKQL